MKLLDLLPPEHIVVPLTGGTVPAAVAALVDRLSASNVVRDPDSIVPALIGRRGRDIATIGPSVALPHLRTEAVDQLLVALGVAPAPLRAGQVRIDAEPTIVALILAPPGATSHYLQTVAALARLFRGQGVVERVAGATSAADILGLPELQELRLPARLIARDVMVHNPARVGPELPVRDAVDLMVRRRVKALPVVGDKDEVLGIITESDVMQALAPQIPRVSTGQRRGDEAVISVRDIMSRSVLCIAEEAGLEETATMMRNKNFEQFPVTSEGRLTGLLSRGDIIRKLFAR
jgi:CBS domain-containing protein